MKHSDKDKVNILFHDNHIVVAVKEKGVLTQPSPTENASLETSLKKYFTIKEGKKSVFLHAVHRLDKDVSGLVVFAKSSKALSRLNQQMREKAFEKIYHARVVGNFTEEEGEYTDYLEHSHHKAKVVSSTDPNGKKCELSYRVLEKKEEWTLLEIILITGRYHQIRCQLAYHNHPILGDKKYGGPSIRARGILLHQSKISFFHPTLKTRVVFEDAPQFGQH